MLDSRQAQLVEQGTGKRPAGNGRPVENPLRQVALFLRICTSCPSTRASHIRGIRSVCANAQLASCCGASMHLLSVFHCALCFFPRHLSSTACRSQLPRTTQQRVRAQQPVFSKRNLAWACPSAILGRRHAYLAVLIARANGVQDRSTLDVREAGDSPRLDRGLELAAQSPLYARTEENFKSCLASQGPNSQGGPLSGESSTSASVLWHGTCTPSSANSRFPTIEEDA